VQLLQLHPDDVGVVKAFIGEWLGDCLEATNCSFAANLHVIGLVLELRLIIAAAATIAAKEES